MELREYQKQGVEFLISRKHSLLADVMGLGKTIQAICAVNAIKKANPHRPLTVLVVCPASVKLNWAKEIEQWGSHTFDTVVIQNGGESIYTHIESDTSKFIIVNYELLLRDKIFDQLKTMRYDVLICDEAHYMKNMDAKRTKRILAKQGLARNAEYKMLLTGTPVLNRPVELFPILATLHRPGLNSFLSYRSFATRYNGAFFDNMGYFRLGRPTRTEELHQGLKGFMLRRTVNDVQNELPDVDYQVIKFPMDAKIIDAIHKEREIYTSKDLSDNQIMGQLAKTRQETALAKLPYCIQYIKDILANEDKVVIFAHHRQIISELMKALKEYGVVSLQGGMTAQEKQLSIDLFQTDSDIKVFIGQIQAAGQGINGLQKVCNHIVFVEQPWVPGELKQAIGRLKRMGQEADTVFVHVLVAEGTLDASIIDAIITKDKAIEEILDNQFEIESLWRNLK